MATYTTLEVSFCRCHRCDFSLASLKEPSDSVSCRIGRFVECWQYGMKRWESCRSRFSLECFVLLEADVALKNPCSLILVLALVVVSCRPATIHKNKELSGDDQRALVLVGISNPNEVFENSFWDISWTREDAKNYFDNWTGRSPGYEFFIDGFNVTEERIEGTLFYLRRTNPGRYFLESSSRTQISSLTDVLGADSGAGLYHTKFPQSLVPFNLKAETITYIGTYEVKKGPRTCLYVSQITTEIQKVRTFIEQYSRLGMPLAVDVPASFQSILPTFCKRIE